MSQRDVFLAPFPFSDQSGKKVRPVLVLSKDSFNTNTADVIVCAITSNITKDFYSVLVERVDFEEGNIDETSQIKVENLLKIDKTLLIKKIGKIKQETFMQVLKILRNLFE